MILLETFISKVKSARPHLLRSGWASAEALVAPIVLFALSPWLLQRLGSDGFGQWVLALTIAGFAHVVSLGAGVSTMYAVAAFNAKGESDEAVNAIRAGFTLALTASIFMMAFAWFISSPIAKTIFEKMGESHIVILIILLGSSALALQEIDAVFAGALRGMQRYDLVAYIEILGRPIWAVSIAVIAYKTSDVISILIFHNIYYLVRLCVRAKMVSNIVKKNCIGFPKAFKSILDVLNIGKWISLQSVGGVLFSTMDKLLVGWIFGSSELARYSICLQVVQFAHNLQASGLQVIAPWVAARNNSSNTTIYKYNYFVFSVWAGIGSLVVPVLLIGGSWIILEMWMGVLFADSNSELLRVLLVGAAILSFTIPAHYVLLGFGKARYSAILLVLAGLLSILTSVSLGAFGLLGFAIGRMVYGVVACLYLLPIWRINSESTN